MDLVSVKGLWLLDEIWAYLDQDSDLCILWQKPSLFKMTWFVSEMQVILHEKHWFCVSKANHPDWMEEGSNISVIMTQSVTHQNICTYHRGLWGGRVLYLYCQDHVCILASRPHQPCHSPKNNNYGHKQIGF